ncbi:hypothetical protein [Halomonas sp. DN3]|uniref:hypothetical protein n=1 Tax=Halomonas TaxID=2745 RepID=UPI00209E9AA3|nr:hypothetical protein [Halomonas sp. DN3]USZ50602.1 hypothetical protein NKF27_03610 [Halomonas sp. DN3]
MSRSLILITGDPLSLDLGLLQTAGDNDVVALCEPSYGLGSHRDGYRPQGAST